MNLSQEEKDEITRRIRRTISEKWRTKKPTETFSAVEVAIEVFDQWFSEQKFVLPEEEDDGQGRGTFGSWSGRRREFGDEVAEAEG